MSIQTVLLASVALVFVACRGEPSDGAPKADVGSSDAVSDSMNSIVVDEGTVRDDPCTVAADCPSDHVCFLGGCTNESESWNCTAEDCTTDEACITNLTEYCDGCADVSGCFRAGWCENAAFEPGDCTPGTAPVEPEPTGDVGGSDTNIRGGHDASYQGGDDV